MFVSKAVLDWEERVDSCSILDREYRVPYSFHRHSEGLLSSNFRHNLIDAISNLKRAVDHRVKHLAATYKIKKIPFYTGKMMDTLVHLEIMKPAMLKELMEIRNALEHRFSDPPHQERCQEFAEMVWYFLKSTDQLAKQVSSGCYLFDPIDDIYTVGFDGSPETDWKDGFSLSLPARLISDRKSAGDLEFIPSSVKYGYQIKEDARNDHRILQSMADRRPDDDVVAVGTFSDQAVRLEFFRIYFRSF